MLLANSGSLLIVARLVRCAPCRLTLTSHGVPDLSILKTDPASTSGLIEGAAMILPGVDLTLADTGEVIVIYPLSKWGPASVHAALDRLLSDQISHR